MRSIFRQRGFLLNPYRFAGTTQSGAMQSAAVADSTLAGSGIMSATVSANASAVLTLASDQAASGALNCAGAATGSLAGASIAATSGSVIAASVASFAAQSTAVTVDAADFDGTNDWLSRTSALASAPPSTKSGTLSLWFKFDTLPAGGSGGTMHLINGWGSTLGAVPEGVVVSIDENGELFFYAGEDDLGTDAAQCTFFSNTGLVTTGAWHHLAIAWDAASSLCKAYYDGSAVTFSVAPTFNNFNFNWSRVTAWTVGADINASGKCDAGLAEMWFAPNQYVDVSVSANLQKFRTSLGKPADLGSTGAVPTGTAPLIYLHLDDAEAAANFALNRTGNGNLTVNGALTTYASSPSD